MKSVPLDKQEIGVYCRIGDAGLKSIATLPELRQLSISSSRITDVGIEHFRTHQKLEHVALRATKLTDMALDHLAQIETMTRLDLYGSGEPGVAHSPVSNNSRSSRSWIHSI